MSAIDTAMLAAMRAAIGELLPDTAYIVGLTNTPDGEGGVTQARGTSGTQLCRLDVVQGREQVSGGAIQPFISYMMSLPYNATVASTNIISHNGTDYAVKSINLDQSWSAVTRLELEKI
jgi:hypothetical protein